MSLYQKYAPPLRAMPLITILIVFVVAPFLMGPKGLTFSVLTLAFIIGAQPHVTKLSEQGHTVTFAFDPPWPLHKIERREWQMKLCWSNKRWVNRLAATSVLLIAFFALPLVLYLLQHQAFIFGERINENRDLIMQGLNSLVGWAQETVPGHAVPDGDAAFVFGNLISDAVGDLKHAIAEISKEIAAIFGHLLNAWLKVIIAMIIFGVLIGNWDKEVDSLKGHVATAFPDEVIHQRIFSFARLYQECLSILLIGYLEVAITLSIFYFLAMTILPFNLSFGFIVLMSLVFGFLTAIWKVGGIATKIIAPLVIIANFSAGIGYFGWEFFTMGLFADLLLKAVMMFAIAFVGGALEAYNYTPEVIGVRLGLTKMQMVMTILTFAIGAGTLGMIWGVLLMLLIPTFTKLVAEEEAKEVATI